MKKKNKVYRIPVEWSMTGVMQIESDCLANAIAKAHEGELPEPEDYIEGSFAIRSELLPFYNKHLTKKEIQICLNQSIPEQKNTLLSRLFSFFSLKK